MKNNRFVDCVLALAALVVVCFAAPASAQTAVWSLTPSSWSALTDNTAYNAASLGFNAVTASPTFRTWAGAGETEPTGGQYALRGATPGYIVVADSQAVQMLPGTDGGVFGGTGGSPASYTGYAVVTVDLMFTCSDATNLTQGNDATIAELTIGASDAYRVQFKLVNPTLVTIPISGGAGNYITNETVTETTSGATGRFISSSATQIFLEKLNQTAFSGSLTLTGGTSGATRTGGATVTVGALPFAQKKGIKVYTVPTSSVERVSGFAASSTLEPDFEFGKVITVQLYVKAGGAGVGLYGSWLDRVQHSRKTAHDTNATLGTANNGNRVRLVSWTNTAYTSGPTIQCRMLPRARVDNSAGWWTTATANPTVAENTGTTRVFHTCFTPLSSEVEGYPLTVTKVTGTPTITATSYGTTSPCPGRSRFVLSSTSVGDVVRVSSGEALGGLEMTADGDQYVGWTSEYVPTGSAVWGIRATNDASSYSIAVNYDGRLLREGSTVGSGTVLFALAPSKVYAVYLTGNALHTATEDAKWAPQVVVVNQSGDIPGEPPVKRATLATAWPTGSLGVMSGLYTVGSTPMEISTQHAGRRAGLLAGDSYGTTYTYQRGTATFGISGGSAGVLAVGQTITDAAGGTLTLTTATVASASGGYVPFTSGTTTGALAVTITGTLTSASPFVGAGAVTITGVGTGGGTTTTGTASIAIYDNTVACGRNNVGYHLAHGAENHFLPNGWRPGKPYGSTTIPDLVYAASTGRSGRSAEQAAPTIAGVAGLNGFGVIYPGAFAYNSLGSLTVANTATTLTTWSDAMGAQFNAWLNGRNTVIYLGGQWRTGASGNFALAGSTNFMKQSTAAALAKITAPSSKAGTMWSVDQFDVGPLCFTGAGDQIHPSGDVEGPRFMVIDAFGSPYASGYATPRLRKVAGK